MFAKLFGPDDDQLLITLTPDEDNYPTISIYRSLGKNAGDGLIQLTVDFEHNDEAWDKAEYYFNYQIDEMILRNATNVKEWAEPAQLNRGWIDA